MHPFEPIESIEDNEQIIDNMINQIWDQYDLDNSGVLDKAETRRFVKKVLFNMGEREFKEEEFVKLFEDFDTDGNGFITRQEMKSFLKHVIPVKEQSSAHSSDSAQ